MQSKTKPIRAKELDKLRQKFNKHKNIARLGISIFTILIVVLLSINITTNTEVEATITRSNLELKNQKNSYIPKPDPENIVLANSKYQTYLEQKAEQERLKKIFDEKVERVMNYLSRQNSPVAYTEIAEKIVKHSEDNGADFRVIIAIMTIESGNCRQSFSHNCFGYLNGAKYPSFEAAFDDLVPKVSRQYAARYGWDFESLSRAYGQHNWQLHSKNMRSVASSI